MLERLEESSGLLGWGSSDFARLGIADAGVVGFANRDSKVFLAASGDVVVCCVNGGEVVGGGAAVVGAGTSGF